MTEDRLMAGDIAAVRELLEHGALVDAVAQAMGTPVGASVRP
jgi:hypothetical protein